MTKGDGYMVRKKEVKIIGEALLSVGMMIFAGFAKWKLGESLKDYHDKLKK